MIPKQNDCYRNEVKKRFVIHEVGVISRRRRIPPGAKSRNEWRSGLLEAGVVNNRSI